MPMPFPPSVTNRMLYQPRSRSEAAAPLDAVAQACKEDANYRYQVAQIIADCLKPAEAEPATPNEDRLFRQVRDGGRFAAR